MSKGFWGVIVGVILVFTAIIMLGGGKSEAPSKGGSNSKLTQHVQGKASAAVTLVEYGDYQCPFCQQYYPTVKQVQTKYNDQIKFQFRNFPLTSLHQNAFAAARAAEAADKQGKFWEMHDLLYQTNDPSGKSGWVASGDATTYFDKFAEQLGLNLTQFKKDFASSAVNDAINADMAEGNKLGITGTPSFFLNGKKIEVNNTAAAFDKVISEALNKP